MATILEQYRKRQNEIREQIAANSLPLDQVLIMQELKHNCFNISIHIAEPLASVLYSRMKRLYHTEVWYGRFLLYPLEGGESDVLIAVIIIVTTNHYFIHSMPSWHVAYIAIKHAVKRYVFSLLWWHAKRRHGNGPQTGRFRTG